MTSSTPRARMPWPLQIVFWVQIAGALVDLVGLLLDTHGKPGVTGLVDWALPTAVIVFLMLKLRAGRRWARSVLTLLLVVGLLFAVFRMIVGPFPPVVLTVGMAVTLVLLHLPASTAYFARRQSEAKAA